jgi:hypothetical protein
VGFRLRKLRSPVVVRVICAAFLLLPPLALLLYVHLFGRNVFWWDDWDLVPLIQKTMEGKLTIPDLFVQHNEHRMLFPYVAMLVIGGVTRYNTVALMFFSWALIVLTAALIFLHYRRSVSGLSPVRLVLTFLPAELLLFSFSQYESILWGFTSEIYIAIFAAVLTFALLELSRKIDHFFMLSMISAIVATFSIAYGMAVWPIGFLAISDVRTNFKKAVIWSLTGSISITSYFIGYKLPGNSPPMTYVLTHPLDGALYFLTLIGGPLADDVRTSATYGAFIALLGIVLLLLYMKSKEVFRKHRFMICLIVFALLSSVATTVGRSGAGVQFATSSRYTPIVSLGLCGLYLSAAVSSQQFPNKRKISSLYHMLLVLVLVGLVVSNSVGWHMGEATKQSRELAQYVLATYQIQSDENICNYLHPCPAPAEQTRERADFLQRYGLGVFTQAILNATKLKMNPDSTLSAVDTIDGGPLNNRSSPIIISSNQQTITITGWAIDKPRNDSAYAVFINVDARTDIPAIYGIFQRPDIADALKNPRYVYSGYWASFSTSVLGGVGEHVIRLKIVSKDQSTFYLSQQTVTIFVIR